MSKYYIGDLCYILPRDLYDEIVCSFKYDDGEWHTVDSVTFAFSNTAYGDGEYRGSDGFLYPVDAGIIGVIKLEGFDPKDIFYNEGDLGRIVEFENLPFVEMSGGVFRIGDIVINTDFSDDEERFDHYD